MALLLVAALIHPVAVVVELFSVQFGLVWSGPFLLAVGWEELGAGY